ncbi:MAG: R3H domain-containing nucleic acid-binding protein [Patescibacteria group bacterium]
MNSLDVLQETLEVLFSHLQIDPNVEIEEKNESIAISVEGRNLNYLIGTHGETLASLEHLLKQILFNRLDSWYYIELDINGYRQKKVERIEDTVKRAIDKIRFFQDDVALPPMNASDRRLVHMYVAEYDDIETESLGAGRERHVVLKKKQ